MNGMLLLPNPRSLTFDDGTYGLAPGRRIVLQGGEPTELLFVAQRLQAALHRRTNVDWEIAAALAGPPEEIGAVLRLAPERVAHPQGYTLAITPQGIVAEAGTPAGLFYAVCTLIQIIEQSGRELPCVQIADWPDFAVRGVTLDISRDKSPTLTTVLELVDMLAGWKINQLQLYMEHTFAYHNHPEVWAAASPFSGQEILELDAYCRQRYVELVPNQNSFGHMHRWLRHPRYAALAETLGEFTTPWGVTMTGPFGLAPEDPGSLELLRGLYDELLPHFSSRMFNIGCDETVDLGQGRSKAACDERGAGRVYLDFLLKIHAEVVARGRTMQFWGDIIIQYPDLIAELPKDAIALEWGYQADHPFAEHCPRFAASGLPFYVCPGTASWCSVGGRTDNAIGNLLNAAENGLKHGAAGYLITDWGDRGHWQTLPISYLGFAAGAAFAWALDANRDMDMARAVSLHAFRDPTGAVGRAAYDLGNIYRMLGPEIHNSSLLFWVLQLPLAELRQPRDSLAQAITSQLTPATFAEATAAIDRAVAPIEGAQMDRPDAGLIRREFANTARLMRHACRRAALALEPAEAADAGVVAALDQDMRQIIEEYRQLWLARNRPGGLDDSAARLESARADYTSDE
jgi:hexosaminidase